MVATQPCGEPLDMLSSPYELIIVLADVMDQHSVMLRQGSYLHRDLSTTNILVVRGENGCVSGLLVGFGNTVKVGAGPMKDSEPVGTMPFISIAKLLGYTVPQTKLDDLESLLYIICTFGMQGMTRAEREDY
ncbi:hypothetical protein GGF46_000608 [Coemansia sp. RSA 552]|nr:hypothetical protein GGF46_004394 [Coemansia sp. RSA 552]KAJ2162477.1 hypothetical protein GGF46_000608 [Coemansia sp. RSA 552]